jgi:hypothetical protein
VEMSSGASNFDLQSESVRTGSLNNSSHVEHVVLAGHDTNSLQWICSEFVELLHKPTEHSWRNGLFPRRRVSVRRTSVTRQFDATHHNEGVKWRRWGDVEGGTRGLSVENVSGEFEPLGRTT